MMEGCSLKEYLNAKYDPRLRIVNACIEQGDYRRANAILDHLIECPIISEEKPEKDLPSLAAVYHAYARCGLNEVVSKIRNTDIFYLNGDEDIENDLCGKLYDARIDVTNALATVEKMSTNKDISDEETKQLAADARDMQITLARINHLLGSDMDAIDLLSTALNSSLQSRELPDYRDAMLHFQLATFYEAVIGSARSKGAFLKEQSQKLDERNKRLKKFDINRSDQEKEEVLVEGNTETVDLKQWLEDMQIDVDDDTWLDKLYHNCIFQYYKSTFILSMYLCSLTDADIQPILDKDKQITTGIEFERGKNGIHLYKVAQEILNYCDELDPPEDKHMQNKFELVRDFIDRMIMLAFYNIAVNTEEEESEEEEEEEEVEEVEK